MIARFLCRTKDALKHTLFLCDLLPFLMISGSRIKTKKPLVHEQAQYRLISNRIIG
jgi:hypothetical protein